MEMNFGGPVWHASGGGPTEAISRELARMALRGVGDASLGEWTEVGRRVGGRVIVHIRRRLSRAEEPLVNTLRDIRGTPEERERLTCLVQAAPHLAPYFGIRASHGGGGDG